MQPVTRSANQRRTDALRACGANPQGLRGNAYPSVMPMLEVEGLVRRHNGGRPGRARYWFLTEAGREALAAVGMGEPENA